MAVTPSALPKIRKITSPQTPNEYNGQFKATQLWNDIIWMLKKNVAVRKRRLKKRIFQTCFTGADAVNTVLEVLQDESFSSSVKEVSREKTVKLCQAFLDSRVFQAVSSKDEDKFEDSSSKYYKFVDDSDSDSETESNSSKCQHDISTTSITSTRSEKITIAEKFRINRDLEPDLTDGVISNPLVINQRGQIVQELLGLSNSKLRHSTPELRRRNLSPCNLFKRRNTLTHDAAPHRDIFTSRVSDDILREIALSRLLRLVDLPILDGLLCITYKYKSQPIGAFNANFRACRSPMMIEGCYDDWTKTALDVLEYVPKGTKVMEAYLTESNEIVQKLKLYQGVIDHYSDVCDPLIPEGFTELVVAILNLIMQRKYFLTIEAIQLLLVLLPYSLKDEIEKLIRFIWAVSREDKIVLDEKLSNRALMEKTVSPVLVRNNILAANQASQIVMFMLDNHDEVFLVPRGVQEQADLRIMALKTGRLPPIMEFTYCERITEEDFINQTVTSTETALRDLMNNILDDTKIPLKEKKTRLKQLLKEHPEVFNKYFAEYL
ncbi:DEP domain-containing protein 7-like isoform X2 [Lineus longissimus]|uniref:DEP domain-containing protein 7-like isoform X2 n=1 Tax=Lineus longissimus TaxID=88925 RepID=UPI002B4ED54F